MGHPCTDCRRFSFPEATTCWWCEPREVAPAADVEAVPAVGAAYRRRRPQRPEVNTEPTLEFGER